MTMWTSSPAHLALFNTIADKFKAENPEVKSITFDSVPLNNLDTVLTTQLQSNDPPDLSWLPVEESQRFISEGALVNVEPALKGAPGYDYADLLPRLQSDWRTSDAQYGVPFSTGSWVMFYNADIFKAANLQSPREMIANGTWDWAHFRAASKQIAQTQKVPGYVLDSFDFKTWNRLVPLMYAYGASPWNATATQCTMNSPEMTAAMSLFHDMIYTDHSTPLPGQKADFWGGQAGATSAFLSSSALLKAATFKWDVVPMPSGPAGDQQAMGQSAIVAFKAGHNPAVAAKFLAYLTNKDNGRLLAQFFPPSRDSLLTADDMAAASKVLSKDQLTPIVTAVRSSGKLIPIARDAGHVADVMNSGLNQFIFQPGANIPSGLNQMCAGLTPLLTASK